MTQKNLCLSAAVALLFGLATTNAVNAGEATLNEAVAKIEAVGRMIAELKIVAVEADAAANQAGAVLVDAARVAASPTPAAAPFRYAHPVYGTPVAPSAYYAPYLYQRCGWFTRIAHPRVAYPRYGCSCHRHAPAYAYPYPYYGHGFGWW